MAEEDKGILKDYDTGWDLSRCLSRLAEDRNFRLDRKIEALRKKAGTENRELTSEEKKGLLALEQLKLDLPQETVSGLANYFMDHVLPTKTDQEKKAISSFLDSAKRMFETESNPETIDLALDSLPEAYRHLTLKQLVKWNAERDTTLSYGTEDQIKEFCSLQGKGALALYQKSSRWPTALVAGMVGAALAGIFWYADHSSDFYASKIEKDQITQCLNRESFLKNNIPHYHTKLADSGRQISACQKTNEELSAKRKALEGKIVGAERGYASCLSDLTACEESNQESETAIAGCYTDLEDCLSTNEKNVSALASCQNEVAYLKQSMAKEEAVPASAVEPVPEKESFYQRWKKAAGEKLSALETQPKTPAESALPLPEPVPTNIYYPKIKSALGKPEAERSKALASVVAEYLQNNGGKVIVDGRTCQEALTNLCNSMLSTGISEKKPEVLDGFVAYGQNFCGTINPHSGRVLFKITK